MKFEHFRKTVKDNSAIYRNQNKYLREFRYNHITMKNDIDRLVSNITSIIYVERRNLEYIIVAMIMGGLQKTLSVRYFYA